MAVWFKVLRVRIGVCRSTNNELFWIIWKKRIDFPRKFVLPMLSMFVFPYFMSNKSFNWNGRWRWHVLVGCHDLSWAWLKLHTQCTKKNWSIATNHPWKIHKKMWNVTLVENYTTIDVILQLCLDWLGDPMVGRLISETIKMIEHCAIEPWTEVASWNCRFGWWSTLWWPWFFLAAQCLRWVLRNLVLIWKSNNFWN